VKALRDFFGLSRPEWFAEQGGWTYFIHRRWTLARYTQGRMIFCTWYWETWPVDEFGMIVETYRADFPYDPRLVTKDRPK
jgi:hypothetical protein